MPLTPQKLPEHTSVHLFSGAIALELEPTNQPGSLFATGLSGGVHGEWWSPHGDLTPGTMGLELSLYCMLPQLTRAVAQCCEAVRVDSMWHFSSPVIAHKPWYPT